MYVQENDIRNEKTYLITELCREFDVTPRALRFYEQRALLAPLRRGNRRIYSRRDRTRLQLILHGKRFGFSLLEIKQILELYDGRDGNRAQLEMVLPKLQAQLEVLRQERGDITEVIADVERYCQQVDDVLEQRSPEGSALRDRQ